MPKSITSLFLVAVQFITILFLGVYAGLWLFIIPQIIAFFAITIGVLAILEMKLKVNVFPEVISDRSLYTDGIYRYIRHPMYLAVLLLGLAWVIQRTDLISIVVWLILFVNLNLKISYEERILEAHFEEYQTYKNSTKRLIPFIY